MDIKAFLRKLLLSRNYYLARIFYDIRFSIKLRGRQPLVIYQMGKVGSTSILHSLQATNLRMPIYKTHALSADGINNIEQMYWGDKPKVFRNSLLPETRHIFTGHFLRTQLNKDKTKKNGKLSL